MLSEPNHQLHPEAAKRGHVLPAVILIGIGVDVLAMMILEGGGPGACAGFVGFPIIYSIAAIMGRGLRWLLNRPSGPVQS